MENDTSYYEDIQQVACQELDWEALSGRTILVSGASGMIGKFLIDTLMMRNEVFMDNISVIALGRSIGNGVRRFGKYSGDKNFKFITHDITNPVYLPENVRVDYIIHAASNTHPLEYSEDPVGTIMTNVLGTNNLLELAFQKKASRFVLLSSVEVYGENRGDVEEFSEEYCGYIDCNTLRAGYPEGKRAAEALCQAYGKARNVDFVILRLARIFGPTMNMDDSRAISQFIKNTINNEDIALKSRGDQLFSYGYVGDAVWGILKAMTAGKSGEAYNVTGKNCNITLRDLAHYLAEISGAKVIFEIPDEAESLGYSRVNKAIMNIDKMKKLNWFPVFDLKDSLKNTVKILKSFSNRDL